MNSQRAIRIIKRGQRQVENASTPEQPARKTSMAVETSRKVKAIVSGWILERQQQRAVDSRQAFASLFQKA